MADKSNLIEDCKKYMGKPPYDSWTNLNVFDSYFYKDMCKKYGEDKVEEMLQKIRKEY